MGGVRGMDATELDWKATIDEPGRDVGPELAFNP